MYPLIFLDTETTDLDLDTSAVIEVALIRIEVPNGAEERFHTLIKPTEQELADAHPVALVKNGYSADPSRWDAAPAMSEAGPRIVAFTKGANTICGHNVSFDENMIKAAFKKHGVEGRIPYKKIDTVTLAYEHLFPLGLKSASLDRIRDFLRWSGDGAHTAMKDTEDAMKLFNLLWRMTPTLRTHLARQIDEYHSLVMLGLSRKGVSMDFRQKALADHEITKLYDTGEEAKPRHVGFKLKRPGTGAYGFELHFTGYGIFLQGDLSPVRSGGFGCRQYKTLGWFLGELSPGYMAEKFLEKGYRPELAASELEDLVQEHEDWGIPEKSLPDLTEIVAELRSGGGDLVSASRLYDRLHEVELGHLTDDGVPGWGYDPDEVAWLVAIQQCFRRTYLKDGEE